MPIQVNCPACGRPLRVPDDLIGKAVKCPGCGEQFIAAADGGTPSVASPRQESYRAAEEPPVIPRPGDEPANLSERIREGEEPRRPSRLPRIDDYEDDDDDFPRRRRRGPSREFALSRVSGPATGLIVVGIINLVISGGRIALFVVGAANAAPRNFGPFGGILALAVLNIILAILILVGAQKMKKLESHGLAKAAAIISMIPVVSPCCLLGLIFGIQALNVLNDPQVKDAFDIQQIPAED